MHLETPAIARVHAGCIYGYPAVTTKKAYRKNGRLLIEGDPYGTRTRVAAVKGQCPRPLDEGAMAMKNRS